MVVVWTDRDDDVRLNLTANALAKALHVPAPRINDIVRGAPWGYG
jgi:plasmid maintenance system antidote protein VapI